MVVKKKIMAEIVATTSLPVDRLMACSTATPPLVPIMVKIAVH